jgi:Beta-ketoacyl synthase, N-terminal domain
MLYIHQSYCISPQQTFGEINIEQLNDVSDKKLLAIEPGYEGIPPGILRRMGKAVRMGTGAAMPIIKSTPKLDGIIIGTAKGGMEDCIKFLNQIIQYDEGLLAPGNFVQSTSNAIAAQLGLLSHNTGYNTSHVHRGLAFENGIIDAIMQLKENPGNNYLLSGVDEISSYNYNIETLAGSYKSADISNKALYITATEGTIAGEGAAAFLVNDKPGNAIAHVIAVKTLHTEDQGLVKKQLQLFIDEYTVNGKTIDLLLSGENGDERIINFYTCAESLVPENTGTIRFKHMCGEYATAGAWAMWLACHLLNGGHAATHMIKKQPAGTSINRILIYNNYKGRQHSFMLVEK